MKMRSRVNPRRDRKIFSRTAARTKVDNIPGARIMRGGIRK